LCIFGRKNWFTRHDQDPDSAVRVAYEISRLW
jgi:hypothetical protein